MEQQRGRLGHMELNSDLTPSDEAVSQFEYRFRVNPEGPDLEVTTPDPQGSLDGPLKIEHDEEENDGQQNLRCDANGEIGILQMTTDPSLQQQVHSSDSNQADETNDGQDQRSIVDDSTIVIKQEMSTTLQLRASGVVHKIEQQDDTTRINTGVNANAGIKTKETVVQDIDEPDPPTQRVRTLSSTKREGILTSSAREPSSHTTQQTRPDRHRGLPPGDPALPRPTAGVPAHLRRFVQEG
ncbi:hypothetical protein F4802DRAFT_67682 [Xylaria palmicola]|nr:hypothetical protein F4802DRAFT_67682 [Xylaria palmicola]